MPKISALPVAGPLDGTELLPVVQIGNTEQTTVQAVANRATVGTIVTTAISYSVLVTDSTVLARATLTLTLPTVSVPTGKTFRLKNAGTGQVTVSCAVNIDSSTSFLLMAKQSVDAQWDGAQYWIL